MVAVMHRLEALRIFKAKLGSVEKSRHSELSENEDLREAIDAKAEAASPCCSLRLFEDLQDSS